MSQDIFARRAGTPPAMNYSSEIVLLDLLPSLKPTAMLNDTLVDFTDRSDIALPFRIGPSRHLLQGKQMSAFRLIAEVAAGWLKRRD